VGNPRPRLIPQFEYVALVASVAARAVCAIAMRYRLTLGLYGTAHSTWLWSAADLRYKPRTNRPHVTRTIHLKGICSARRLHHLRAGVKHYARIGHLHD
jgi:hypothetical protein